MTLASRGLALMAAAILAAACEGNPRPEPDPVIRSPQESAAGLLKVELQLAAIEDFISTTPDVPSSKNRLDAIAFFRAHIVRCAGWLADPDEGTWRPVAANVGLDLAGVGYDLVRTDLEATFRNLDGLAREPANKGLNALFDAARAQERAPSDSRSLDIARPLMFAVEQRDNLMRALPVANVMRAGVQSASIVSGGYSLARAVVAAGPALQRLAAFLGGPVRASLSVAPGGAAIQLVASGGALVVTEAELLALVKAGTISVAAVQLHFMASGRPPKVPDPGAFADWIQKAPKRPASIHDAEGEFQVKQCGDSGGRPGDHPRQAGEAVQGLRGGHP